ncbi:MAG: hypothetical protein J6U73_02405, partial [Alistipes sp.]|nr:hypothetical protein [Alistipes sp.]
LNQEYERDADTYANRFTLGAVYKPYSFLRLQLNYAIEKSGLESSREYLKNNGLNFMVTAIF